jgi:hypothetical protein
MKRYDSSRMIRVVLTQAMLLDQQGLLPPTGSIDDHR